MLYVMSRKIMIACCTPMFVSLLYIFSIRRQHSFKLWIVKSFQISLEPHIFLTYRKYKVVPKFEVHTSSTLI